MTTADAIVLFIDVGQGDSSVISCGDITILIDSGNEEAPGYVTAALRDLNTDRIDLLIATHFDDDHIGGMDDVLRFYEADRFLCPDYPEDSEAAENLQSALERQGLARETPEPGDVIIIGDVVLTILHPPVSASYEEENNYSLVIKAELPGGTVLFTGDAEEEAEKAMRKAGYDLSADILKVGHHGAKSSTGKKFLKAVSPKYAVISCGIENSYKHPSSKVMTRLETSGITTYVTSINGRITCCFNEGEEIRVIPQYE